MQELTDKKIIEQFKDKINDENVISDIFDYLEFDCLIRSFVDSNDLDKQIKKFYNTRDVETLTKIINMILNGKKESKMDENAFLMEIIKYIDDNISEDFSIEHLAKEFHISYYYLCHFFNKKMGVSLSKYRNFKRLEKAIQLLMNSKTKISEIATICGFDNLSYFSETFIKYIGKTPTDFRKKTRKFFMHDFYELEDMLLASKMQSMEFLGKIQKDNECVSSFSHVHIPNDEFGYFLHEAAIIEFKGVIYASWYNCKEKELVGYTPIVGRRSFDCGKTWTEAEIIAQDKSEKILFCPPVYGICDGKLYMLINQMVFADYMHALDLYVLNEQTGKFEFIWSRPIPFKLNTNVVHLPNGKLLLPGRLAEMDGFPNTPAVLISDSGKIEDDWRIVKVAKDGALPDGEKLVHAETTVICVNDVLYMFNRNDRRKVPLVYVSKDFGESWSEAMSHDIPYVSTKMYGGTLLDGRCYLIANIERFNRSKLVLYISEKNKLVFNKQKTLMDCEKLKDNIFKCHYPSAYESDGILYIIATADYKKDNLNSRGAILFKVDLKNI